MASQEKNRLINVRIHFACKRMVGAWEFLCMRCNVVNEHVHFSGMCIIALNSRGICPKIGKRIPSYRWKVKHRGGIYHMSRDIGICCRILYQSELPTSRCDDAWTLKLISITLIKVSSYGICWVRSSLINYENWLDSSSSSSFYWLNFMIENPEASELYTLSVIKEQG